MPPSRERRLFHDGQLEGRKVKLPVFLARRPAEPVDPAIQMFYTRLLLAIRAPIFGDGDWKLCERSGWPDNSTFENVVAWSWVKGIDRRLIVVNLSERSAQAQVRVPWEQMRAGQSGI